MKTEEMIAVMQAHLRGEKIECRPSRSDSAWTTTVNPSWFWSAIDFRIAPKPEPKMPDGIFWVRSKGGGDTTLIIKLTENGRAFMGSSNVIWDLKDLNKELYWSHDRKTWFTFTGEEVKS